ncbi:MAG: ABC transporter ATP-binding protein [Pseudomonadota bacterium]
MAADDSFISIRRVSKHFGLVKAVDDISFDIRRGEFFSLLGASGCGKTTLLRMLAGFEVPTSGEFLIDGQPMAAVPPHLRPTNMVFQNYAIFPHLNVHQNIAYGLRKKSMTKAEIDRTVEEALAMIKLPGYGNRRADQLSGGQRQRIALARALVCKPKVLLLDEPLGALDKKLREEMQLELRQLQRSVGITFVFVTHDQEEALTMSDRIAVMARGKVLQIDSSARLYEHPNCREVADFIGTMNFIDGEVSGLEGSYAVIDAGPLGKLRAPKEKDGLAQAARVTLAIRPEKLRIDTTRPNGSTNAIPGRLNAQAYLGDRSHFFVEVPGLQKRIAVAAQNAQRDTDSTDCAGREVWISWPVESGVLLPAD